MGGRPNAEKILCKAKGFEERFRRKENAKINIHAEQKRNLAHQMVKKNPKKKNTGRPKSSKYSRTFSHSPKIRRSYQFITKECRYLEKH